MKATRCNKTTYAKPIAGKVNWTWFKTRDQGGLNFHRDLRTDEGRRAVEMILKMRALFRDLAVYISVLGSKDAKTVMADLEKHKKEIRKI